MSPKSIQTHQTKSLPKQVPGRGRKSAAGVALVGIAAVYSFLVPVLNERFGLDLPQLRESMVAQSDTILDAEVPSEARPDQTLWERRGSSETRNSKTLEAVETAPEVTTVDRRSNSTENNTVSQKSETTQTGNNQGLRYGLLEDLGGERFRSPEGLIYTRGSKEGHRLKHVEVHTADIPDRPGPHGVFDGGMEKTLRTIDLAYKRAKANQRTTVRRDGSRTIYTVDMGRRVGYVGGQTGGRQRNPMARRVQLVLDGDRVITAFPRN